MISSVLKAIGAVFVVICVLVAVFFAMVVEWLELRHKEVGKNEILKNLA